MCLLGLNGLEVINVILGEWILNYLDIKVVLNGGMG